MTDDAPSERLVGLHALLVRSVVVECAVRALIADHPNPERVRVIFDQLVSQVQALRAGDAPEFQAAAREAAETLFRPAVRLDTGP